MPMPVGSFRDSSSISCRIEPGSPDISETRQWFVPLPTFSRVAFGFRPHPISLLRSVECGLRSLPPESLDDPLGYRTPCPNTGAAGSPRRARAFRPPPPEASPPIVSYRERWPPPRLRRGDPPGHRREGFSWSLFSLDPLGFAPFFPAESRLAHAAIRGLPFPVHPCKFLAFVDQGGPQSLENIVLHPPLIPTVNRTIVSKGLGQHVPLDPRSKPEDDSVHHLSQIRSRTTRLRGWVQLRDNGLHVLPHFIRNFPYRFQRNRVHRSFLRHPCLPLDRLPLTTLSAAGHPNQRGFEIFSKTFNVHSTKAHECSLRNFSLSSVPVLVKNISGTIVLLW